MAGGFAIYTNPLLRDADQQLAQISFQYVTGAPNASAIPPETYTLDYYLMTRPGNAQIQLDLLLDYKSNVELYPSFHHYFRQYQPPVLAIWGKNDQIFIPAGSEAYKRDNPNAIVKFVDAGHFALCVMIFPIVLLACR